jgi:Flp pilus assembly CpaE family ATPase
VVTPADAKDVLGREVYWKIPNDYRAFADAVTRGRPITDRDSSSALAKSFYQLGAKLGGTSEGESANGATTPAGGTRLGKILRIGRKG